jgi:cytochrome P450
MRTVIARVLERADLRAVDEKPAKTQFRVITLAPKGGVKVRLSGPPRPGAITAAVEREPVA